MSLPEFRNAKWAEDGVAIDCEINHEKYGWIPFTCVENDGGALFDTTALYAQLLAAGPADYVAYQFSDEQLAEMARQKRNTLLSDSDWTQLPDVPESVKSVWGVYRNDLRNVPQQEGFPRNIVWPIQP